MFGKNGLGIEVTRFMDEHTGIFNDFYLNFNRVMASESSAWFNGRKREDIYKHALNKITLLDTQTMGGRPAGYDDAYLFFRKAPQMAGV